MYTIKKNSRGFSLAELMIVFAIIGILAAVVGGASGMGCVTTNDREKSATRNAKQFATSMGIKAEGISCSGSDSDLDGYVSCTLNTGDGKMQSIQCGYDQAVALMGQNEGCKLTTPITVQGQQ